MSRAHALNFNPFVTSLNPAAMPSDNSALRNRICQKLAAIML